MSKFGPRRGRQHQGVDIRAPRGSSVRSVTDGTLISIYLDGERSGYGNSTYILNHDGTAAYYAHLEGFAPDVRTPGTRVRRGQLIGFIGTTEKGQTGERIEAKKEMVPHLHLEIHRGVKRSRPSRRYPEGRPVIYRGAPERLDPIAYLKLIGGSVADRPLQ